MKIPSTPEEIIAHHVEILLYHDTGKKSYAANARRFAELWEELIPKRGQAESVQGEILRAIGRIASEDRRNGNGNWDSEFEKMVDFLDVQLPNESVFDRDRRERIRSDIRETGKNGRGDLCQHDIDVAFGRLIEDSVEFCRSNPNSIAKPNDPDLRM